MHCFRPTRYFYCTTVGSVLIILNRVSLTRKTTKGSEWCDKEQWCLLIAFLLWCSHLQPSVLWHCWLCDRKSTRPVWPSWCHCHSLSVAPVKSRLVLPFWYRLTQVVPRKRAIKQVCVFVCSLLVQGFGSPAEYVVPWAHLSQQLWQHVSRFSRFCTAHHCVQYTDTHTVHATSTLTTN